VNKRRRYKAKRRARARKLGSRKLISIVRDANFERWVRENIDFKGY
jgi:hypothetical protein